MFQEQKQSSPESDVCQIARRFIGTPYHHCGRIEGVGIDCANLLCLVYEEAGLAPHCDPRPYPPDWAMHRGEERFIRWLEFCGGTRCEAPRAGVVALFRYGRCFSHGAIMLDDVQCVHAYKPSGKVIISRIDQEPLFGRECQFWEMKNGRLVSTHSKRL